jgi:hypothetical protein
VLVTQTLYFRWVVAIEYVQHGDIEVLGHERKIVVLVPISPFVPKE